MTTQKPIDQDKCITLLCDQNEMLTSEYGTITYLKWCELEAKRMTRSGSPCRVVRDGNMVAVERI